jgi:hypothetical protein
MQHESSTPTARLPWYGWLVGIIGLLWNAMGVLLWGGSTFAPAQFLADLPPAHRIYVDSLPLWSTFTWGLGVLAGLAGCIFLLMRSKWSVMAFALSLFGAIANTLVYVTNPAPPGFVNPVLVAFIIGYAVVQLLAARQVQAKVQTKERQ